MRAGEEHALTPQVCLAGLPKAVALSHYNLVANTLQSIKHYKETFGVDGGSRESIVASTLMYVLALFPHNLTGPFR